MLQRVNIELKSLSNIILPYTYNYQLGCEIYKKINLIDNVFGSIYHKDGLKKYKTQRNFKLLNPLLQFKNQVMDLEGIIINKEDIIILSIGGHKSIINKIINGFYQDNKINLDGNMFEFVSYHIEKSINLKNTNIYKIESTVIESIQDENKHVQYLDIMNPQYIQALKQNLKRKYSLLYDKEYIGDLEIGIEDFLKIKPKTINIKGYYIQGYGKFNIIIKANTDMQKIAYYCGIGSHNMYGAGFLKHIMGRS